MTILQRIRQIINANLNDLLERVESPEAAVDQMIRDMETAIIEMRRNAASVIACRKMTERRRSQAREQCQTWQDRAESAVREGKDELARTALVHRRTVERRLEAVERQLEEETVLARKLKEELRRAEEKTQEIRAKRDTLVAKKRAVETRRRLAASTDRLARAAPGGPDPGHEIINGFDHFTSFEDDVDRQLAECEAREELESGSPSEDMLGEAADSRKIDDELAGLKKKLRE